MDTQPSVGVLHGKHNEALAASMVQHATAMPDNKISLLFTISDGPGALGSVLLLFQKYNLNLTRIESRPSKR